MASNVENVEKEFLEVASQAVLEEEEEPFAKLKNAAKIFLKNVEGFYEENSQLTNAISAKSNIQKIYAQMKNSEQETQRLVLETFSFEEAVNEFLNRNIYLTFVKDDGSILFFEKESVKEIYGNVTRNKGRGGFRKIKESLPQANLEKSLQTLINDSIQEYSSVYTTALERYRDKKNGKRFYWIREKSNRRKYTKKISDEGRIAEGYAESVLNQHFQKNNDIEKNLSILENYIKKDFIFGFLKGDIILKETSGLPSVSVQFAVKKENASTEKIGPALAFAYNILQISSLTSSFLWDSENNTYTKAFKTLSTWTNLNKSAKKVIQNLEEEAKKEIISSI
jgi:hypothetical protein